MSRIQDILSKAERDGNVRHTHAGDARQAPRGRQGRPARSPHPAPRRVERRAEPEGRALPEALREVASSGFDPLLVAASAPHSLAAEQYRTLRTRLVLLEEGRAAPCAARQQPGEGRREINHSGEPGAHDGAGVQPESGAGRRRLAAAGVTGPVRDP